MSDYCDCGGSPPPPTYNNDLENPICIGCNKLRVHAPEPRHKTIGERELDLDDLVDMHPNCYGAEKQLKVLQHCRNNPFSWWWWDVKRYSIPGINWKSPMG